MPIDLTTASDLVDAVAGRLRSLGEGRLARSPLRVGLGIAEPLRADGPSVAERAHAVAQALADAAALVSGVSRRLVPRLGDLAVGDQVAVTGHDLIASLHLDVTAIERNDVQAALAALRDLHRTL